MYADEKPNNIYNLEDLLEEGVAVDKFLLMLILQLVRLDVLPECRNDDWPAEKIALDAFFLAQPQPRKC